MLILKNLKVGDWITGNVPLVEGTSYRTYNIGFTFEIIRDDRKSYIITSYKQIELKLIDTIYPQYIKMIGTPEYYLSQQSIYKFDHINKTNTTELSKFINKIYEEITNGKGINK